MARILTTEEVAEKLHVKPLTVRKYLRKGIIPGRRLGREWRIPEAELESFLSGKAPRRSGERVSLLGICADIPGFSTEEFLKNKQKDIEMEEAKLRRLSGATE